MFRSIPDHANEPNRQAGRDSDPADLHRQRARNKLRKGSPNEAMKTWIGLKPDQHTGLPCRVVAGEYSNQQDSSSFQSSRKKTQFKSCRG
jgi:hypothetical protein